MSKTFEETFRQKAKDEIKNINSKPYNEKILSVKDLQLNTYKKEYNLFDKFKYDNKPYLPSYLIFPIPKPTVFRSYY